MRPTTSSLFLTLVSVCQAGPFDHLKRVPGVLTTTTTPASSASTTTTPTVSASTTQAQCTAGPRTINGRLCNVTCGLDRPGGDYGALYTGSFEGCIAACAADSRCVTAQLHVDSGYCYLKDVSDEGVPSDNNDTVDCGPATSSNPAAGQCTPGTQIIGSRSCNVTCGMDRPGGDYGNQQTWDFDECVRICAADSMCVTVQYHEDNGFCYFKNTKNAGVMIGGEDTADCDLVVLLADGQGECRSNNDCQSNYCNSFLQCGKLADGQQYCGSNADCQNGYCNAQGTCGKLADGAACTASTASSCASGVCNANSKCGKLADGQSYCRNNGDCTSGFCNSRGVCGRVQDGGGCDYDSDCVSNLCNCGASGPRNCGFGVCGLGRTGSSCLGDYQCASGSCFNQACQ